MASRSTPIKPNTQTDIATLSIDEIAKRIVSLRGQRVILDADLAAFYGESTKRLNQQVSRNMERFPSDFMFRLNDEEFTALRLQSATSKQPSTDGISARGGRRYAPLAFTEHGAIMASMVLASPRATALSVYVVRAFVHLRSLLASNRELTVKVDKLERKVSVHERNIAELVDSMTQLMQPPNSTKRPIGFIHPKPSKESQQTAGNVIRKKAQQKK